MIQSKMIRAILVGCMVLTLPIYTMACCENNYESTYVAYYPAPIEAEPCHGCMQALAQGVGYPYPGVAPYCSSAHSAAATDLYWCSVELPVCSYIQVDEDVPDTNEGKIAIVAACTDAVKAACPDVYQHCIDVQIDSNENGN